MKTRKNKKSVVRLSLSYITLAIIAIIAIYPAFWVVLSSLKTGSSLYSPTFIPQHFTVDHYKELFTSDQYEYGLWYWNTFKIATISMFIGTTLVVMAAYTLSMFRFGGRKSILSLILVLGMFPGFMSIIAIYIILLQMHLLDTHTAMILVYSAGAALLGTLVVKGFFDTIPKGLIEAARIDGANHFKIFIRIILPLSKPMLVYIMLTNFVGYWNDFILSTLILRTKEKWTLAVGLLNMVETSQNSNFTLFAAGTVLVAIPITLLFLFLQRYLVEGITAGATKG